MLVTVLPLASPVYRRDAVVEVIPVTVKEVIIGPGVNTLSTAP